MAKGKLNQNWKQKFLEWKESGKNSHAWSKENNIPYTTLLGWKRRFRNNHYFKSVFTCDRAFKRNR